MNLRIAVVAAVLAGMAGTYALAFTMASASPATTVTLTARYSRFSPAAVEVAAGTTVRFVVKNLDPIAHELIVGDAATQDRHERGADSDHGELVGEVSIKAGETAETTFVFDRPGSVAFGCHLPGHWNYGMRGSIAVS